MAVKVYRNSLSSVIRSTIICKENECNKGNFCYYLHNDERSQMNKFILNRNDIYEILNTFRIFLGKATLLDRSKVNNELEKLIAEIRDLQDSFGGTPVQMGSSSENTDVEVGSVVNNSNETSGNGSGENENRVKHEAKIKRKKKVKEITNSNDDDEIKAGETEKYGDEYIDIKPDESGGSNGNDERKCSKTRKKMRMKEEDDSNLVDEAEIYETVVKSVIETAIAPCNESMSTLEKKYEILLKLFKEIRK